MYSKTAEIVDRNGLLEHSVQIGMMFYPTSILSMNISKLIVPRTGYSNLLIIRIFGETFCYLDLSSVMSPLCKAFATACDFDETPNFL